MDLRLKEGLEAMGFRIELKGEIWVVSDCFGTNGGFYQNTDQSKAGQKKYYEKNNLKRRIAREQNRKGPGTKEIS